MDTAEKNKSTLWYIIFLAISIIASVLSVAISVVKSGKTDSNAIHFLISIAIVILILSYGWIFKNKMFGDKISFVTSIACILFSCVLYILFGKYTVVPIYALGAMLASGVLNLTYGLYIAYFFMIQSAYFYHADISATVAVFIMNTAVCYAAKLALPLLLKQQKNEIADTNINEVPEDNKNGGFVYIESLASDLDDAINNLPTEEDIIRASGLDGIEFTQESVDLSKYTAESFAPLAEFKETKKNVFVHSKRVAFFATACAEYMKADVALCRAISLYHEIGKMREGDFIENTINICKENDVPEIIIKGSIEVSDRSCEGFTTREATIVFVAETVLNTYFYLKGQHKPAIPEKIVDSAMGKLMLGGKLNGVCLSVRECTDIRGFFIDGLKDLEEKNK